MGSSAPAAGGETWGYRELPLSVAPPRVDGRPLEFGSIGSNAGQPQLAFLRHTAERGWHYADTPVDEAGKPYRGFVPNNGSRRASLPRAASWSVATPPGPPTARWSCAT